MKTPKSREQGYKRSLTLAVLLVLVHQFSDLLDVRTLKFIDNLTSLDEEEGRHRVEHQWTRGES